MRVKELVAELQKHSPDAEVVMSHWTTHHVPRLAVQGIDEVNEEMVIHSDYLDGDMVLSEGNETDEVITRKVVLL
jgi:hypothetical protein